jgi:uncharacterized protein (DUF427 family)
VRGMSVTRPTHAELLAMVGPARAKWAHAPRPVPEPVGPGEESVWGYPRPPLVRQGNEHLRVQHHALIVADTTSPVWVCETAGAPVPYFAPESLRAELVPTDYVTLCEWKGAAVHYDLVTPAGRVVAAAYSYPDPLDDLGRGFGAIAGRFALYPAKLACFVNDERVQPQPGGYYGGWVTARIKGPIKGAPGTGAW